MAPAGRRFLSLSMLASFARSVGVAAAFTIAAGLAQANATHAAFVDVAGAAATDGFNDLTSSRLNATASGPNSIRAGILANVFGNGGAVFKRTSGTAYPASFGIYEWGGARSTFELNVGSAVTGLTSVTFQSFINVDNAQGVYGNLSAGNLPVLSYNGGTQLLAASSYTATPVAGGVDMDGNPITTTSPNNPSYAIFSWDLSSISTPITSFNVRWATDAHANTLAFQLDQVAAVPEPSTYAFAAIGLVACGWAGWRRRQAARVGGPAA